jgi:hypothetical protein
MIYSRHEIVELIQAQPRELHGVLTALVWFASRGDPNLVSGRRYGLLQVDSAKFEGKANELLNPETNIKVGAKLIQEHGLIEFCGWELGRELHRIIGLARYLDGE